MDIIWAYCTIPFGFKLLWQAVSISLLIQSVYFIVHLGKGSLMIHYPKHVCCPYRLFHQIIKLCIHLSKSFYWYMYLRCFFFSNYVVIIEKEKRSNLVTFLDLCCDTLDPPVRDQDTMNKLESKDVPWVTNLLTNLVEILNIFHKKIKQWY